MNIDLNYIIVECTSLQAYGVQFCRIGCMLYKNDRIIHKIINLIFYVTNILFDFLYELFYIKRMYMINNIIFFK